MVRCIGSKIRVLKNLFTDNLRFAPMKNMENIVLQNLVSMVRNKSDVGTQCSLSNDLETLYQKPDNGLASEELIEYENNADMTAMKRKISDWVESSKKPKKAKCDTVSTRPGFSEERFNETSYYFENGLRKVYPYYFTFTTYTKGRWAGRTLLEVFGKEFRAHSSEEYERHIENGSLTINNERVSPDYVLKHNDLLANMVHRHEVPVTSNAIDIIHIDKDIVVINKPSSIPVHPCGRYRHNTIIFLLAKEYNLKDLKTIHRLDRLTSGVLMFGRTQSKAQQLEAMIRDREVKKQYVCRVEGKFPETVECNEPIEVVSYKIGVCKVSAKGKKCMTSFLLIGYNEKTNTSVVLCEPRSGRMHQIRVHLQYLGYPIQNDPLYNDKIFGPEKGRGGNFGKTDEQLIQDLIHAHNAENWLITEDGELPVAAGDGGDKLPAPHVIAEDENSSKSSLPSDQKKIPQCSPKSTHCTNMSTQTGIDVPDMKFLKSKSSVDPHCRECKTNYRDPEPKDLIMYLHALKYSGPGWSYETPMPVWADVKWEEP